jgi:DNA-binding NarL/FixJ family response regulator
MSDPARNHRILVADDSPDIAGRIAELVSEVGGVEVVGLAHRGDDALSLLHQCEPDGAILDFSMPGLNGLEVLREIRTSRRRCWVIVITSAQDPSIRIACLEAGADHFLQKGEVVDRLRGLVAVLVRPTGL